jgi:hypothetical protein
MYNNHRNYTQDDVRVMAIELCQIVDDLDGLDRKQDKIEEDNEIMDQRIQRIEFEIERFVLPTFIFQDVFFF